MAKGDVNDPFYYQITDGSSAVPIEQCSVATVTSVASSATSVTLLAASARRGATIYNDSTQVLYMKFGITASNTSYTVQLASGDYWEMPYPIYTGRIDGIWASANGNARITELT